MTSFRNAKKFYNNYEKYRVIYRVHSLSTKLLIDGTYNKAERLSVKFGLATKHRNFAMQLLNEKKHIVSR